MIVFNKSMLVKELDVNGNLNMSATNITIYFGGSYISKSGGNIIISD